MTINVALLEGSSSVVGQSTDSMDKASTMMSVHIGDLEPGFPMLDKSSTTGKMTTESRHNLRPAPVQACGYISRQLRSP